jgi:hypothetical protein
MNEFSVVLLNYSRPKNIHETILPEILKCVGLKEVIVSHGRMDTVFAYPDKRVRHRLDAELNSKWGVGLRFVAGATSKTDCVVLMDDDILVDAESLRRLVNAWAAKPGVMHSFNSAARWSNTKWTSNDQGRNGGRDALSGTLSQTYATQMPKQETMHTADIVLTRCCAVRRSYIEGLLQFVAARPQLLELLESATTKWNGEDICLSMYVAVQARSWHSFTDIRYQDLPSPNAISHQTDHHEHRSKVVGLMTSALAKGQRCAIVCTGTVNAAHEAALKAFADSVGATLLIKRTRVVPSRLAAVAPAVYERIEPLLHVRDALATHDRALMVSDHTLPLAGARDMFSAIGDLAAWDTYVDHLGVFGDARYDAALFKQKGIAKSIKSYINGSAVAFRATASTLEALSDSSLAAGASLFESPYGLQTYLNAAIASAKGLRLTRLPYAYGYIMVQKYEVSPLRSINEFTADELDTARQAYVLSVTGYFQNRERLFGQLLRESRDAP